MKDVVFNIDGIIMNMRDCQIVTLLKSVKEEPEFSLIMLNYDNCIVLFGSSLISRYDHGSYHFRVCLHMQCQSPKVDFDRYRKGR
jgi:hypothetical protein